LNLYPSFFAHEITRPFFFRTGSFFWIEALILVLSAIFIGYTLLALIFRVQSITLSKPESVQPPSARLSNFINWVFNARVPLLSGIDKAIHFCYTVSLTLLALVFLMFIFHFVLIVIPFGSVMLLTGLPYLLWSAMRCLAGLFLLAAVGIDIFKRTVLNFSSLKTDGRTNFFFFLIIFYVVAGTTGEAGRIALSGRPQFEEWNFLAWPLSYFLAALPQFSLEIVHDASRFSEYGTLLLILYGLTSGRYYHTLLPAINICRTKRSLNGEDNYPLAAGTDFNFSNPPAVGAAEPRDLTPNERLSLTSCISCGNCQANCPAWTSEQILSPMLLIKKMVSALENDIAFARAGVTRQELDACFACAACMESCPSLIEHVPLITRLRTHATSALAAPAPYVLEKYRNLHYYGTSTGVHVEKRWEWLSRQNYVRPIEEQPDCDFLLFVGCGWSDPSKHRELIKFVEIIRKSGLKISTLGPAESCCGDMALRTGNHLLFKKLAMKNMAMFAKYNIKQILILCPHGYSALRKEYRFVYEALSDAQKSSHRGDYGVTYYTDFLSNMGREGKLDLKTLPMNVTVHDPCFPGRSDQWYRAPRELLSNIPGVIVYEMQRTHKHSVCCGMSGALGSGNYKFYGQASEYRARDAISTGAETIVTSCHYCRAALSEALLSIDEDKIAVKSLIDVVHASLFQE